MIMGVSFAYVPSMQAIAEGYGISTILGAQIVGGIVAIIMGLLVKKIRVFFPPLITGTKNVSASAVHAFWNSF